MTARRRAQDEEVLSAHTFHDPYDAMSDDDFTAYTARLFDTASGPTRSITVRMPEALLSRLQHIASQRQMPYQVLMKRMLEESVAGLERRTSASAHSEQGGGRRDRG